MPPDYQQLLDQQTWDFIHKTEAHYDADATEQDVASQRRQYNALCEALDPAPTVDSANVTAHFDGLDVPLRHYRVANARAALLFAHGGGFVVGNLDSHHGICADLATATGCEVYAIDYRLAPEHTGQDSVDDTYAAYRWLAEQTSLPIVGVGDSAGGSLIGGLAHRCRDEGLPLAAQVLIYPALCGHPAEPSFSEHANAPMLSAADMEYYRRLRDPDDANANNPYFWPAVDSNFAGLPPTIIFTADCDPLRDDAAVYAPLLRDAGVPVLWHNELGSVHGYLRARRHIEVADSNFARITVAITEITGR